jgi:hypothetical protein
VAAMSQVPKFSPRFREQLIVVVSSTLGAYYEGDLGAGRHYPRTNELWIPLHDYFREELGVTQLSSYRDRNNKKMQFLQYLRECSDREIEARLRVIAIYLNETVRDFQQYFEPDYEEEPLRPVDQAIRDLNRHLESNGIELRITDGAITARDRELTSQQIETPAMRMLGGDPRFNSAAQELTEALNALRSKSAGSAIRAASHALESTIHIIGTCLQWPMTSRQISDLLPIVRSQALLGGREANTIDRFTRLVEVAVGGARNVEPGAGHGAGADIEPDIAVAEFVVDVACAAIKLLYVAFRRERA